MAPVALGLALVPALDHAVKLLVRHALGHRAISLGALGELRLVEADVWLRRLRRRMTPAALWMVWTPAAATIVLLGAWLPWSGWFSGLLLGGSLSHVIEVSRRGTVTDYVRLRGWPAFDLADVAVAAGVCGMVAELVIGVSGARP